MAGLGRKVFEANEVLTAADVNGYLMDQAIMRFANSASRTTVIGTPTEGMFSYLDDTNALEVFDGSSWTGVDTTVSSLNATAIDYTVTSSTATAYTLGTADANTYVRLTAAGTVTINSSTNFPVGDQCTVLADGTALTIEADAATLAGAGTAGTAVSFTVGAQYEAVSILCVDTDAYRVIGNITAS